MKYLSVCKVRCKKCGDVLGREFNSPTETGATMEYCSCGAIGFDPDPITWRISGNIDDCESLFEVKEAGIKEIIIRQVAGSMAIEGMDLTEEDKERIRKNAYDKEQIEPVVADLVKKHSKKGEYKI